MFRRLLGLVPPEPAWFTHAPLPASSSPVTLSYLGTAGFVLSAPERTVVLDPFVSRHPLGHLLANKPLPSDPALVQRLYAPATTGASPRDNAPLPAWVQPLLALRVLPRDSIPIWGASHPRSVREGSVAFVELQLASDFCNGIPLSDGSGDAAVYGDPNTKAGYGESIADYMRDKTGGPVALTDLRDIYENNANHGARRLVVQLDDALVGHAGHELDGVPEPELLDRALGDGALLEPADQHELEVGILGPELGERLEQEPLSLHGDVGRRRRGWLRRGQCCAPGALEPRHLQRQRLARRRRDDLADHTPQLLVRGELRHDRASADVLPGRDAARGDQTTATAAMTAWF